MFDVIIVGAGSVGCATARELSRYRLANFPATGCASWSWKKAMTSAQAQVNAIPA